MDWKRFFSNNWPLLLGVIYLFFPIDVIPDSIPLVGITDDSLLFLVQLINVFIQYRKQGNLKTYVEPQNDVAKLENKDTDKE
ncbi:MAG TPA: YkvA family protein [Candidatus Dojkabacteria bacterium]|nr:YkvA family protein [Candidatus Dojkabacteria bacterium]